MKATIYLALLIFAGSCVLGGCQKEIRSNPNAVNRPPTATAVARLGSQQTHSLKGAMDGSGVIELINNTGACYAYGTFEGNVNLLGKFQAFFSNYGVYGADPSLYDPFAPIRVNTFYQAFRNQYMDVSSVGASDRGYYDIANIPMKELEPVSVIVFDRQGNAILAHADSTQTISIEGVRQNTKLYFTITGGMGKFTGATGSYIITGYTDLVPPFQLVLRYALQGEIRY